MSGELYRELRAALLGDEPVAFATVTSVEGEAAGRTGIAAKLVVRPDGRCLGTLGDPELDRIATARRPGCFGPGRRRDPPLRAARRGAAVGGRGLHRGVRPTGCA